MDARAPNFDPIRPRQVRYIKLGPNNAWAQTSFDNNTIEFGHDGVPHDLANSGNWEAVRASWDDGVSKSKTSDYLREVKDFYSQGSDCLWITFAKGRVWWAFAETEVALNQTSTDGSGSRYRRVIGSWQSTNRFGTPLLLSDISSILTKTGAYRKTICKVEAEHYALRLINGKRTRQS